VDGWPALLCCREITGADADFYAPLFTTPLSKRPGDDVHHLLGAGRVHDQSQGVVSATPWPPSDSGTSRAFYGCSGGAQQLVAAG
jgi:hypothetical protein